MEHQEQPQALNKSSSHSIETERDRMGAASLRLRRSRELIQELWEERVRDQVLASRGHSSLVLLDSLPIFISKIADALDPEFSLNNATVDNTIAGHHGGERAAIGKYNLPQLLREFSILREVVTDVLYEEGVLDYEVRNIVDQSIDSAGSQAATEFVRVQNSETQSALLSAQVSNKDLDRFAAVAAHDLKSPLATISGYLEVLDEEYRDKLGGEGGEYIDFMQAAARRMRNLIDSLLEYARLVKKVKPFQPVDTGDTVRLALQNLEDAIEKAQARVIQGPLPCVMGDRDLLTVLFQNLLSNSIKFRSDRPLAIRVGAEESDGQWVFSVQDNGIGFDPKEKESIFSFFKKLHSASEYSGSGIGLATSRKVVELHGGKIWAESEPENGSTFYFSIPKMKP